MLPRAQSRRFLLLGLYAAALAAPLLCAALAGAPAGRGLALELAAALGLVALPVLCLQPLLTRGGPATAALGARAVRAAHRRLALIGLALVSGHVALVVAQDPARFAPGAARWPAYAGALGLAALLGLIVSATRRPVGGPRRTAHRALGGGVLLASAAHVAGVGQLVAHPVGAGLLLALLLAGLGSPRARSRALLPRLRGRLQP